MSNQPKGGSVFYQIKNCGIATPCCCIACCKVQRTAYNRTKNKCSFIAATASMGWAALARVITGGISSGYLYIMWVIGFFFWALCFAQKKYYNYQAHYVNIASFIFFWRRFLFLGDGCSSFIFFCLFKKINVLQKPSLQKL
jgi:hypothetical protein